MKAVILIGLVLAAGWVEGSEIPAWLSPIITVVTLVAIFTATVVALSKWAKNV